MAADFIRCDDEFIEIGEDLDMTNFGTVKSLITPVEYVFPDISQELAMLERYAQKEDDNFDHYAGFCAVVVKRVFGSTGTANG